MKAFIFDMDGVLIDSEPLHARIKRETFRHYAIPFDEQELSRYVGRTSRAIFGDMLRRHHREDLTVQEVTDYKHARYIEALRHDGDIQPIDGILPLCANLRAAGIPAALASSSVRCVIHIVLERFGLDNFFQAVLSGAELPRSKPDPAVYLLAAERLGQKPEDCVVLEDAAAGIAAAKEAGMYCIAYRNPNSGRQDLSRADRIVDHIQDIHVRDLQTLPQTMQGGAL